MDEPVRWRTIVTIPGYYDSNGALLRGATLAGGVQVTPLEPVLLRDENLEALAWNDRETLRSDTRFQFELSYMACSLGDPDPAWSGKPLRSKQSMADEKIARALLACWVVRPTLIGPGQVFHIQECGETWTVRESARAFTFVHFSEGHGHAQLLDDDMLQVRTIHEGMLGLDRDGTIVPALSMLGHALREREWKVRYLLMWVGLEALFGPDSPSEVSHRIALRMAYLLGGDAQGRWATYRTAKKCYSWRSKIAHGLRMGDYREEEARAAFDGTENLLRQALLMMLLDGTLRASIDGRGRDEFFERLVVQGPRIDREPG